MKDAECDENAEQQQEVQQENSILDNLPLAEEHLSRAAGAR
jgi:hypothetical protein